MITRHIFWALLISCGIFFSVAAAASDRPLSSIKHALLNFLQYDICWGGGRPSAGMPYRFGKTGTVIVSYSKGKDRFFLWSDDLYAPIGPKHDRLAAIYYGASNGEDSEIENVDVYNVARQNALSWVGQATARFHSKSTENFVIDIPSKCAMEFPPSEEKTGMVNAIVNTMSSFVVQVNKTEHYHYPIPLKIVIANFNVTYPRTFVYIETTGEIYSVELHNPDNYFDDTDLKHKLYPFNIVGTFHENNSFVRKIIKNGLPKEIKGPIGDGGVPSARPR